MLTLSRPKASSCATTFVRGSQPLVNITIDYDPPIEPHFT
jgi:hypothetical protein